MLFVLTGDIQIGKTRWLLATIETLSRMNICIEGVVAPGVWVEKDDGREKLAIDNMLLPQREQFRFATRIDLVEGGQSSVVLTAPDSRQSTSDSPEKPSVDASFCTPHDPSRMGWSFDSCAIERVNEHFAHLASLTDVEAMSPEGYRQVGLLVVDELGKLELMREEGLTEALALLDRGPSLRYQHALVVVRSTLLELVTERYVHLWGDMVLLSPQNHSMDVLAQALTDSSN